MVNPSLVALITHLLLVGLSNQLLQGRCRRVLSRFLARGVLLDRLHGGAQMNTDLPGDLAFEKLSYEEKYHRAVPGYMKRLHALYRAVYDRFGEDGLEMIRDVSREFGTRVGANVRKRGEVKGLAEVGSYLLKVFDMVSDDWSVKEFTEDRLVVAVARCPYGFERDELCRAHTCMEEALVAALDDRLDYRIGESIPQGHPHCEHILSRSPASP
jgi:hypothetical protein